MLIALSGPLFAQSLVAEDPEAQRRFSKLLRLRFLRD
jgi:hypothetical protein